MGLCDFLVLFLFLGYLKIAVLLTKNVHSALCVLSVKGFSFFGMVPTFYNQKKPTLTARGEQLDVIRVASQGQNIALLQLIPTPRAGPAEHKGESGDLSPLTFGRYVLY